MMQKILLRPRRLFLIKTLLQEGPQSETSACYNSCMVVKRWQEMRPKTQPWYRLGAADVAMKLSTDVKVGLAGEEIEKRRERFGENTFKKGRELFFFDLVYKQVKSPLVLLLFGAALLTLILAEFADALVIFLVAAANVLLGARQEGRASQAFKKIAAAHENFATVIRGGEKLIVRAAELVPGDLVILSAGDVVPADGRLVETNNLWISEAALTGEWLSVPKDTERIAREVRLTEAKNMVWLGTTIASGTGLVIITETGEKSEMGKIAATLVDPLEQETPFQREIKRLSKIISIIILGLIVILAIVGLARGLGFGETLTLSIAMAVAALPAGLPVVVTIILAIGLELILRRGGLVKNLVAAETLGSTTVILTDKTGTLTRAEMTVSTLLTRDNELKDNQKLLELALRATDAFIDKSKAEVYPPPLVGRPIDRAILAHAIEQGRLEDHQALVEERLAYIPFDSAQRFAGVLYQPQKKGAKRTFSLIGAPELLLQHSKFYSRLGRNRVLKKADREYFENYLATEAKAGARVVAVAFKQVGWDHLDHDRPELLSELTFAGLVVLTDPIREDVSEAISLARGAGLRVIMVTGDNAATALSVAQATGIVSGDHKVILGDDLSKFTEEELDKSLAEHQVFARLLPEDKLRILRALQKQGEIVAMTGDGVNDAPTLRHADIGLALGSGTDLAKEAADLVLVDNSFNVITAAIEEGRRILDNLKKATIYLFSTSLSEIVLVGSALVLGLGLPILPTQILWTNVIEQGFMALAFAFEPAGAYLLKRNPRSREMKNIITPPILVFIIALTALSGLMLFGFFFWAKGLLGVETARTLMFIALSLDSLFLVFSLKNLDIPIWKINPFSNRHLVLAFGASIFALVLALALPPLRNLLHLTTPKFWEIMAGIGFGLLVLGIAEMVKYLVFKRTMGQSKHA